ncbi:MAG: hypothetical protein Q8N55_03430 [bacterium]|nr:hypothetical protein [bacterium]
MYHDLEERINKVPARLLKIALKKELDYQWSLSENGVWMYCFSQVLKNILKLSNGQVIWPKLEQADPDNLKCWIKAELAKQKDIMEKERGKRTNFYRPFCSLILAVLERIQNGN